MGIRWDLKPVFRNAPEGSERALWTRRSAISVGIVLAGAVAVDSVWGHAAALVTGVIAGFAFDAGDFRNEYFDGDETDEPTADESETVEPADEPTPVRPAWLYDDVAGAVRRNPYGER